jgi:flagellar biogenesis protein FliO
MIQGRLLSRWMFAGMVLSAGSAFAQQSVYTPYVESRPIAPPAEPRFPVQLAAAEGPIVKDAGAAPLRLTPRSAGESHRLDRPVAPTPGGAVGTVVGSLGVVLGLFLVLVWCTRRFAPAGSTQLPKEVLEMLGRSSLSPRQQVQLVRLGNKLLLVAMTPTGAETLTEITDPEEVERLASLCRRGQPASASGSFTQVLSQLTREPAEGGFAGPARRSNSSSGQRDAAGGPRGSRGAA